MIKEIEEMANDLAKACPDLVENSCGTTPCVTCLTEALYNAGYQKIIWHKVADGDLPEKHIFYLCYTKRGYMIGWIAEDDYHNLQWYIDHDYRKMDYVIAWTELPTYEGESK